MSEEFKREMSTMADKIIYASFEGGRTPHAAFLVLLLATAKLYGIILVNNANRVLIEGVTPEEHEGGRRRHREFLHLLSIVLTTRDEEPDKQQIQAVKAVLDEMAQELYEAPGEEG